MTSLPTFYGLALLGFPPLVVGLLIALLGVVVLFRERASVISLSFLALTALAAIWLTGTALTLSATTPPAALHWLKIMHLAAACIPSAIACFALAVTHKIRRYRPFLLSAFALSLVLIWTLLYKNMFPDVRLYPWGYYAAYRAFHLPLFGFCLVVLLASGMLFWREYRRSPAGRHRERFKIFSLAFGLALLTAVDCFSAYGVPVPPLGFIGTLLFMVLAARGIWRYHLSDITAAFAAAEIVETIPNALLVLDPEGFVRIANEAACLLFGRSAKDMIGKPLSTFGGETFSVGQLENWLLKGNTLRDYEFNLPAAPGEDTKIVQITASLKRTPSGEPAAFVCMFRDVTTERRVEAAMRNSESRFQRLMESNIIGILHTDLEGHLWDANDAFCKMIGYSRDLLQTGVMRWSQITPPEFRSQDDWAVQQIQTKGSCPALEKEFIRQDGIRVPVLFGIVPLDTPPRRCVCFVIDVSARRRAMDELHKAYDELESRISERTEDLQRANLELKKEIALRKHAESTLRGMSLRDPLTELYNRRGFLVLAEQQLLLANRDKKDLCLFFADIDGLKPINDQLGHAKGDQAIVEAAHALRSTFRQSDIVARIGGDEFAIIAPESTAEEAELYRTRMQQHLDEVNAAQRLPFRLSVSLGVAHCRPGLKATLNDIMRQADEDLYRHKNVVPRPA